MFGLFFISSSKIINIGLLLFGVIILFYLAYEALSDFFSRQAIDIAEENNGKTHKNNFLSGVLLSLGNPALILILMGLVGAELSSNRISLERGMLLSLGMLFGSFIFFSLFILLIQIGKRFVSRYYLRYISLIAGLMLLYFGIRFGINLINLIK